MIREDRSSQVQGSMNQVDMLARKDRNRLFPQGDLILPHNNKKALQVQELMIKRTT